MPRCRRRRTYRLTKEGLPSPLEWLRLVEAKKPDIISQAPLRANVDATFTKARTRAGSIIKVTRLRVLDKRRALNHGRHRDLRA